MRHLIGHPGGHDMLLVQKKKFFLWSTPYLTHPALNQPFAKMRRQLPHNQNRWFRSPATKISTEDHNKAPGPPPPIFNLLIPQSLVIPLSFVCFNLVKHRGSTFTFLQEPFPSPQLLSFSCLRRHTPSHSGGSALQPPAGFQSHISQELWILSYLKETWSILTRNWGPYQLRSLAFLSPERPQHLSPEVPSRNSKARMHLTVSGHVSWKIFLNSPNQIFNKC